MPRKRALLACSNDWDSPFQVGSHHIARGLVRAGYDVAFISDPISPLHLCHGWTPDLRRRVALYRRRGRADLDGHLWAYVPGALLTPHNKPILRSETILRRWHRWCWPNPVNLVRSRGFADVDLLYIDSVHQAFWLDGLDYDRAVYRVADYNPHFEKYTQATRVVEPDLARRVDLVVYPSRKLEDYVVELGARRRLLLPNGVDFEHFTRQAPSPLEYAGLPGPIAVYVGVIPGWFHFDWVREAAKRLPETTFVLIGPDTLARTRLAGLANVRLLGVRPYAAIPGYLQHAHVGLMPFNVELNPRGVEVLQPQKLYAYLACGLPVVSSDWANLRALGSPAALCRTVDQFVVALRQATTAPRDTAAMRHYASGRGWNEQVASLLEQLDAIPARTAA